MMYNMDISTARKDLAKLVTNLPAEGIPLERYGKVVALLVRPEYAPEIVAESVLAMAGVKPKVVKTRKQDLSIAPKSQKSVTGSSSLERTKTAQKARDDLLRGINRG